MKRRKDTAAAVKGRLGPPLWIGAAVMGFLTFLVIYGVTPLNPCNDAWIMAGYDEMDLCQHYAGWLAFRNSEWSFPLGMASQMAVGTGTIISFTDSIPWVAMLLKLFRGILPETFQYFGIYTCVCYMLQAVAAFRILYWKTNRPCYSYMGTVFFCFSPVLMERAFRHTALGSQFLILFSLELYLRHRRKPKQTTYDGFLLLEILSVGIHPYFLPMVACFALLCCLEDVRRRQYLSVVFFGASLGITWLSGFLIGVLGPWVSPSRSGYGYYSMNLNAPYNPVSCGGYTWSGILKVRDQILGNYDGFNYLGVGIMALALILLALLLAFGLHRQFAACLKRNWMVAVMAVLLTLFAVSNVVTFNGSELLTVPLPDWLMTLCGIFRASSRLFYPVFYLIYFFLLFQLDGAGVRKKCARYGAELVLLLCVGIQLFDLKSVIVQKHRQMRANVDYVSILDDMELESAARNSRFLIRDGIGRDDRPLTIWALKHQMQLYYSVAIGGDDTASRALGEELLMRQVETGSMGPYMVATRKPDRAQAWMSLFSDAVCYTYEDIYLICAGDGT